MSRCCCCNEALTDSESTRRSAKTNEFMDMCDHCLLLDPDDFLVLEREDLKTDIYTDWDEGSSLLDNEF